MPGRREALSSAAPAPIDFLLVTWPGGGNVNPLLALARRLVARGHRVRAMGSAELAARFAAADVAFVPHRTRAQWAGVDVDWPDATHAHRLAWLRGMRDDVEAEIARAPTGALLVDYMQPDALCAAEASGRPTFAFVHTLYNAVAIGPLSPIEMMAGVDDLNLLRAERSLPRVSRSVELLDRATRVLVVTTPALDPASGPIAPNVRFVGPLVDGSEKASDWAPPEGDAPLVVVSLGTTPLDEVPVLQRVLDALAELNVRALATVGDHLSPDAFTSAGHVDVRDYVPHAAVLPHATLFVGHAGLSGVAAALRFGVPMLCLPLGRDQPANAAAVEALGVSRTLPSDAPSTSIARAIAEMLDDPAPRARARAVAAELAALPDPVLEIERALS